MKINKYPDSNSYVTINNKEEGSPFPKHLFHKEVTFRINTYEDLWHLNQLVDAWNNNNIKPTLIIPNLIDAQADRRFSKNQSSGLKLVCNFLNNMDAKFKIFHPHNPEVVEALIDNVEIIDNSEFIKDILGNKITGTTLSYNKKDNKMNIIQGNNLILLSPDAGAYKWLNKTAGKINWKGEVWSASKYRNQETGKLDKIQLPTDDFKGKDILIVDDISIYGGTFKKLATELKKCNVGKLYLAVSHMTVQNLGEDPVTNYFEKVFVTNSKFDTYYFEHLKGLTWETPPNNLEIIKMF